MDWSTKTACVCVRRSDPRKSGVAPSFEPAFAAQARCVGLVPGSTFVFLPTARHVAASSARGLGVAASAQRFASTIGLAGAQRWLRTGCPWKALPKERFGSANAVHQRFLDWERAGVFASLWKAGLAEYDAMEGIAWRWQSIDGAMFKAPLAQEAVGPNPTDRGKKGQQASPSGGRAWRPLVPHRHRGQRP
ncbi:hypothetical protein THIX_60579 [Thiomonas sp. X19]|nr:hypothetical protein THIX_60579 [Thiomonas sp. X19]